MGWRLSLPSLTLGSVSIEPYHLSDATGLRAATADSFAVPPVPADPRVGCREWTKADFGTASHLVATSAYLRGNLAIGDERTLLSWNAGHAELSGKPS
jgi:hypothetical protein